MTLPQDIAELLWSHDASRVDPDKDARTVIMAVIRLGSWDQVEWLFSHYGWGKVEQVVGEDYFGNRSLPVSVRAFWGNLFWPELPPPELTDQMERWRPTRSQTIGRRAAGEVCRRLGVALVSTGLSQKAFASLLGTSQPRLSSYLSGKVTPSASFLIEAELVAKALEEAHHTRAAAQATVSGAQSAAPSAQTSPAQTSPAQASPAQTSPAQRSASG